MTDTQLLIITTIVGLFLTYITTRSSVSTSAVSALAQTVETLQKELEAEQKRRVWQAEEYEKKLSAETKKREELELRFEKERSKYQGYIESLIVIMKKNNITDIPEWDVNE
jgi:sortase (surface protein transpeptidase)